MFDLVKGLAGLPGDLFEAHPNQDGTGDMVADDTGLATLAAFQARELLGFAMKLLDFPAQARRLLCSLRVILSQVVGYDIIRAQWAPVWRQHHPEEFHLMLFRKAFDLDQLAMATFLGRPVERVHTPIGG